MSQLFHQEFLGYHPESAMRRTLDAEDPTGLMLGKMEEEEGEQCLSTHQTSVVILNDV